MKTQLQSMGLGLLVATVVSLFGATSTYAFPGRETRVMPVVPPVIQPVTPRLGIMGHVEYGWGMAVDSVIRGTAASRIGLERGDVILRINGQDITSDAAYRRALINAVRFENGLLRMQIADVRSGRRVFRMGNLNANAGPSLPRSAPFDGNRFDHDHHHDHADFGVRRPTASVSRTFRTTEW